MRRLLFFALVAAPPTADAAQARFRQDVVVTAAASPVELGTVTRTLTVITREQIDRLPVHSIADVLRLASAVDVRARGERGMQTDFSIRGAHFGQMLVLIDGVRLNDAQSGHHNGDIPVPLDAVERIEVLHGAGSSLFGADAVGGTINVITRRAAAPTSAVVEAGSFGLIAARAQGSVRHDGARTLFAAAADRSAGFMVERGFATASASVRTSIGDRTGLMASYVWKDFGANGFYGNAPSHEWTNQTLVTADHLVGTAGPWRIALQASYRTHGDRFVFDVRRPALSDNRHRTHAVLGGLRASRAAGSRGSMTAGLDGGADWVRSTNLGDGSTRRVSGFAEWRHAPAASVQLDTSLRVDRYNQFGTSWSPAAGVAWWPSDALRVRASTGRAFRIPTFTERFYSDPAHLARPEVDAEKAWAAETGVDLFAPGGWTLSATLFGRREHDVIDWLRPTPADRWQTYNIREVEALGVEFGVRRTFADQSFLHAGYTALDVSAAAVTQLSKYVLDYAPHALTFGAAAVLPARFMLAPRLEVKQRTRPAGISHYVVADMRVSRAFGAYEIRVEGTNLGGAAYEEVVGVPMPGRAATISVAWRP